MTAVIFAISRFRRFGIMTRQVLAMKALAIGGLAIGGLAMGALGAGALAAQQEVPAATTSGAALPSAPPATPAFVSWPDEPPPLRHSFLIRGESGARVLQGGIGLLAAAGGPLPASPSTAGQRLHGSPRFVGDVGLAIVRVNLPALQGSGAQDPDRRSVLLAPRFTVAAGVFEGFSPAPTVGGVGSVDVVGELRYLPMLAPDGIEGASLAWGLGARIGILRESFTLPGVTLVAMHRRTGRSGYRGQEVSLTGGGELTMQEVVHVSPSVSSLRAVVGKDLLAVGVNAGVQRDWIRGDARIDVFERNTSADTSTLTDSGTTSVPVDRTTWFVGLNRTSVVTQASLELGWSPAAGGRPDPGTTGFPANQNSEGAFSAAISFRITY